MAMQKSRRSRARRGAGRAHFSLVPKGWTVCKETGEVVPPHRVSELGYYKGKKVLLSKEELKAQKSAPKA
jgi:large subunit ribosomal protein L32